MPSGREIDVTIRELAAAQQGLVARWQLTARGVAGHAVDRRVSDGRLTAVRRGVYCVGPVGGAHLAEMAAVLSCGSSAVVGEWNAARMLGLVRAHRAHKDVQVLVRRGDSRRSDGVRARRCPDLHDDEIRHVDGVPVTSPARTLLDLAARATPDRLEQLMGAAVRQGLVTRTEVETVAARHPRHRGARVLRVLLADVAPASFTRSDAEALLLAIVRSARLPRPEVNVQLHGFELDAYWRRQQLVVEVDGFAYHGSETSFHSDRRRDGILAAAGIVVIRLTWRHLTAEREATIARLAAALVQREIAMRCNCGAAVVEAWQ